MGNKSNPWLSCFWLSRWLYQRHRGKRITHTLRIIDPRFELVQGIVESLDPRRDEHSASHTMTVCRHEDSIKKIQIPYSLEKPAPQFVSLIPERTAFAVDPRECQTATRLIDHFPLIHRTPP